MDKSDLIPEIKSFYGMFSVSFNELNNNLENHLNINSLYINYHDTTKITKIIDKEDNLIGCFIGLVIDYKNRTLIQGTYRAEIDSSDDINVLIEYIYSSFAGSWLLVIAGKGYERIYMDPCGSYSMVYCKMKKIAASTTGVILQDTEYVNTFDHDSFEKNDIERFGWYPAGITAHKNISRAYCNHYLDLNKMTLVRHWPVSEFTETPNNKHASQKISDIITGIIDTLCRDGKTCLTLTGGKDSRLLFSCATTLKCKVDTFTIDLPGSELDVVLAKKIHKIEPDLKHNVYPYEKADKNRRNTWLYTSSHCIGGVNQYYSPSLSPLKHYKYFIGGAAGEIGRGFLWHSKDKNGDTLTTQSLINRLGINYSNEVYKRVDGWLNELKDYNIFMILDLAYQELRVSPWAFAQSYSYEGRDKFFQISPFVCRELIETIHTLSPDFRKSESYIIEGIKANNKKLLSVYFNRYGDIRDFTQKFKRFFKMNILKSKIKKLLS